MPNDRIRAETKKLTLGAVMTALGVAVLALGSLIEVLDLSTAVLASLFCVFAVIELGGFWPWAVWLATGILAVLLLPQKSPALFYALFAGYYPILKEKAERLRRLPCLILKLAVFHAALVLIRACVRWFFPDSMEQYSVWLPLVLYGFALVCFLLYDFVLTRLITFYFVKLRKRIFRS